MLSKSDIILISKQFSYDPAMVNAVIQVEGAGRGFDPSTGKILIQFEPHYFKRHTKVAINNGVGTQPEEWIAFNEAFKINPTKAMLSTSWGMMQVMGENFRMCGYKSVDEMVDDFKKGEYQQVSGACTFIKNRQPLHYAMKKLDFAMFAYHYNGKKYYLNSYDKKLKQYYDLAKAKGY